MVFLAGQGIAQPENDPFARRNIPVEPAVGLHLRGQIDHAFARDRVRFRDLRRSDGSEFNGVSESGFAFPVIHAWARKIDFRKIDAPTRG